MLLRNQTALITLLLAVTDRFGKGYGVSDTQTKELLSRVKGEYERAYYTGIILTGGGALLHGMPQRLQSELNLEVTVPEDPLTTVAFGAGRLLDDPEKLQRATLRLDVPAWQSAEKLIVNW